MQRNICIEQINVVTTFLFELLDKNIYVTQLKDFAVDLMYICHLFCTLYNLKQTSQIGYLFIRDLFMKKLNFINSNQD